MGIHKTAKNHSLNKQKMASNIGVSHQINDFDETPRILTLEDKPILESGKISENNDILHSAEMRDSEIAQRNNRRKARLTDKEDKFGDRLLPGPSSVLPQYDEPEADFSRAQFTINNLNSTNYTNDNSTTNQLDTNNINKTDTIIKNLKASRSALMTNNDNKISSDFMSPNEYQNVKRKQNKKRLKKRRKITQQTIEKETKLDSFNEFNTNPLKIISRGSRRNSKAIKNNDKTELNMNDKTNDKKFIKMEEMDNSKRFENSLKRERKRLEEESERRVKAESFVLRRVKDDEIDDEDDADLERVLASERREKINKFSSFDATKLSEKIRKLDEIVKKEELEMVKNEAYNETEDFLQGIEQDEKMSLKSDSEDEGSRNKESLRKVVKKEFEVGQSGLEENENLSRNLDNNLDKNDYNNVGNEYVDKEPLASCYY